MIIHMFPKSRFTEFHVTFINNNFDKKEQEFVLYTNVPYNVPDFVYKEENVFDLDKHNLRWLLNKFKSADGIVFHTIGVNIYVLAMLFVYKKILQKSMWLIWGADLYCYREERKDLPSKIVEYLRKCVISNFAVIATLTKGDYELAQKWYHVKAPNVRLDYCYEYQIKTLQLVRDMQEKRNARHRILLGNSATKTNRHEEIIKKLVKFENENFELITPLSYGDMEYGQYIRKAGTERLGNKFIPILRYMDMKEYYELLNSVDAAIFNNDRQQALGNITALLYLGKKVYIRKNTSMWEELVDIQGYRIHSIDELESASIEDIVHMDDEEKRKNFAVASEFYSVDNRKREWEEALKLLIKSG